MLAKKFAKLYNVPFMYVEVSAKNRKNFSEFEKVLKDITVDIVKKELAKKLNMNF